MCSRGSTQPHVFLHRFHIRLPVGLAGLTIAISGMLRQHSVHVTDMHLLSTLDRMPGRSAIDWGIAHSDLLFWEDK